jgi:purine-binding chemotaxis protein CheW
MATEAQECASPGAPCLAGKYLTFTVQGESCAMDVLHVREIIRLTEITTVPQMPAYIRGVINLRGKIIPVIDLRIRFGFSGTRDTEHTCIMVVQVKLPSGKTTQTGLIVDGVEEVVAIGAADIEDTPALGFNVMPDYVMGLAKVKGAIKTLVNVHRLLTSEEFRWLPASDSPGQPARGVAAND